MKELLKKALTEAGKIQLEHYGKVQQFKQKESISSILTEVDMLCDDVITGLIKDAFPLHNILSEETGFTSNNSKYTWVIDPLDGTSNFAAGLSWFGVLIAVFENNFPVLAGAYLPVDDKLYFAESGKGAFLNEKRITIPDASLKNVLFAFSTDHSEDINFLEKGLGIYKFLIQNTRNTRSTNSLVDFMLVAEGKLGGLVNLFTKIWDIAAPWLIIKESGGAIKQLDGQDLNFEINRYSGHVNFPVIAGSYAILNEFEEKRKILNQ
jgi:myo-inositol-1(or 4)-monophosphatase